MQAIMITDPHRLLRDLNHVLAVLTNVGFGQPSYGLFYGGDPRHFTPDADAVTPEEYAKWQADCVAFANGEQGPTPPSCAPNIDPFSYTTMEGETRTMSPRAALLTRSFYGLGTNFNTAEAEILADLMDLQQRLERATTSPLLEMNP